MTQITQYGHHPIQSPPNTFGDNTGSVSVVAPIFGYLTLNQTRKVVFLRENENNIRILPLVGVWIRLADNGETIPSIADANNKEQNAMYHPLVWAACVRFCRNRNEIRERVLVADGTFLVVRNKIIYMYK